MYYISYFSLGPIQRNQAEIYYFVIKKKKKSNPHKDTRPLVRYEWKALYDSPEVLHGAQVWWNLILFLQE